MFFHGKNLKIIRRVAKRGACLRINKRSGKLFMRAASNQSLSGSHRGGAKPIADPHPLIFGAFAPECKPDGFDRRMQVMAEPDDSADLFGDAFT